MRQLHLFALAGALTLVIGVAVALPGEPAETAEVAPAPSFESSPPTSAAVVLAAEAPGAEELAEAEEELTDEAITPSTTTTSTTTTVARSTSNTGSGSSGSSGGSGSTPSPTTTQPTTPTTTSPGGFNSGYESEFRGMINSLRASAGLSSLSSNGSLNSRARGWAKSMAESGQLKHSSLSNLIPPWSAAGENVGKGTTVSSVFNGLANSGPHRANMTSDNYTDFGVGVYVDGNGTIWTVHVFAG